MTGSISEDDCFGPHMILYNMFAAASNSLLTFSKQEDAFEKIPIDLQSPQALTFISSSNMLVSSLESNEVRKRKDGSITLPS